MKEFVLNVKKRSDAGTTAANRWRREALVPAVLYARARESLSLLLEQREFEYIAKQARSTTVFRFKSPDSEFDNRRALIKEVQRNYLTGAPLHVDFRELRDNEQVRLQVPIHVTGEAYGVKNEGGVLTVALHALDVLCLPDAIPDSLSVDVSELKVNQGIKAADIRLPQGVTLKTLPTEAVVSVTIVREVVETPAAPAEGAVVVPEGAAAAVPAAGEAVPAEAAPKGDEAGKKEAPKKETAKKG